MRFKSRVVLSAVILLTFSLLSALHLFAQVAAPDEEDAAEDRRDRAGLRQKFNQIPQLKSKNEREIPQIIQPPLPKRHHQNKNRSFRNESVKNKVGKERRPAWERGSSRFKGWDDQDVVGEGHPWQQFHRDIHQNAVYSEGAPYMVDLLHDLATVKITNTSMFEGGSQVKLDFRLADGNRVIVKPMRSPREFVYKYDHDEPFWLDQERHNAEIAAFHLDKVLDFRRVPPCVGRLINLTQEILFKSHDQELLQTFLKKDGNLCFIGKCAPWFCNSDHPICAKGEMLEVSMCQFLPTYKGGIPIFELEYPWSQGVRESKVWKGRNICVDYLKDPTWTRGRFLLDLIEQGIFDFLIRNYDRHHIDMMRMYKRLGCVLFLDNGKGFGNPHTDDETFLAPVYQCCKVRRSTFARLTYLTHPESRLSDLLRISMSHDPIAPVVTEAHLLAMDRRLGTVLQTIKKCIRDKGQSRVLVERLDESSD